MTNHRYWLARAARGTMMIEGLVAKFDNWEDAQDSRARMQGNTTDGLSGDVFVVIDAAHMPQRPDLLIPDVNVDVL